MSKVTMDRVSGMNLHYRYFPMETFLGDMKELGVSAIEIWGGSPHFYLEDRMPHDVKAYGDKLRSEGFQIVCLTPEQCSYPINIASQEEVIRRRSVAFFKSYIEAACDLNCPPMLVTTGYGYYDKPTEDPWSYAREALHILAEYGQRFGVKLALEVLRTDESNLVNNLPSLQKMLGEVNHRNLGGMVDTIPMALAGETPGDYIKALGKDLVHMHFIDGAPWGHLVWGDGVLPLDQYIEQIETLGYEGYLSLEITDRKYFMEPGKAVERSLNFIKSHL